MRTIATSFTTWQAAVAALGFLFLVTLPTVTAQSILYVDDDAPAHGNGLNWNTAFRFLADAIEAAPSNGISEIRVAQGLYYPDRSEINPHGSRDRWARFMLPSGLALRGGYAGLDAPDPDYQDFLLQSTILTGDLRDDDEPDFINREDNSFNVIVAWKLEAPATLEGLTIENGHAVVVASQGSTGGGIFIFRSHLIVRDCQFLNNLGRSDGGAVFCCDGSVEFERCRFVGNTTNRDYTSDGGAIYCRNTSTVVRQCLFKNNYAKGAGGAIKVETMGALTIEQCSFIGNHAEKAGGAITYGVPDRLTVTNSLFHANSCAGKFPGGIASNGAGYSQIELRNCTFTMNSASEDDVAGAFSTGSEIVMENCIFWGNSRDGIADEQGQLHISNLRTNLGTILNNNCIQGWTDTYPGTGNIGTMPIFKDYEGPDGIAGTGDENLHVQLASPTVNAGTPIFEGPGNELDLSGQPRLMACRVDMGAYEAPESGIDCNNNGITDECDLFDATSSDDNMNGIPDECDPPRCFQTEADVYVDQYGMIVGGVLDGHTYFGVLIGTRHEDVIVGTDGDDIIIGLGGDDQICALDGNDFIIANRGDDRIDGGDGFDVILGGVGRNLCFNGEIELQCDSHGRKHRVEAFFFQRR